MDPKLLYWTAALVNLGVLSGIAVAGVLQARRGEIARHQRSMKLAATLVLAFVASYVAKLFWLGREDMSTWTLVDLWVLRIHECFVLVMIVGGLLAFVQARRLQATRLVSHDPEDPLPDPEHVRIHRLAGRASVIGSVLAFVMAIGILAGMYARASG